MKNKNIGIVATIVAVIFCGLPGFVLGVLTVISLLRGSGSEMTPTLISLVPLFLAASLMLFPVCVGLLLFRRQKNVQ